MFERIEEHQRNNLPSETEEHSTPTTLPTLTTSSYVGKVAGKVKTTQDPRDPEKMMELEEKALEVYEYGLSDEVEYKHRKATADTIMEMQGRKGGKKDSGPTGPVFVFSDEAAKNLLQGLVPYSTAEPKDVTHESFKISPGGHAE